MAEDYECPTVTGPCRICAEGCEECGLEPLVCCDHCDTCAAVRAASG